MAFKGTVTAQNDVLDISLARGKQQKVAFATDSTAPVGAVLELWGKVSRDGELVGPLQVYNVKTAANVTSLTGKSQAAQFDAAGFEAVQVKRTDATGTACTVVITASEV